MPVCIALLETDIVDAHAFELNWSEVVVSKMQKCSSETRKKCRVAAREERCERRRRIQKEGSAGPGSRVQQM